MSAPHHQEHLPKAAIRAACGLVLLTLAGVGTARLVGMQPQASPVLERAAGHVAAVKTRDLRFFDQPDGSLRIVDATSGGTADVLEPGSTSGFIRGVMRGMARERLKFHAGHEAPFRLTLWANGQLSLADAATGRIIELSGFGDTNRAAFMGLLK
jgi:putative photosynthetic complex assembly protein